MPFLVFLYLQKSIWESTSFDFLNLKSVIIQLMTIEWKIKPFEALSVNELYDILQLRSRIFVVEQNCVYLDPDGRDKEALHLFGIFDGKIVAHARLFASGITFEKASIGRVTVDPDYRDRKW